MQRIRQAIWIILSIATGSLFLYSAYTKLFPIIGFEYTIADTLHVSLSLASVAARFIVSAEAGLGALILLHVFGRKKWALWAALFFVVVFSLYLIYLWLTMGNNVNCGCFGDAIWMTPSASLAKNAILIALLLLLLRYHKGLTSSWTGFVALPLLICALGLPYLLYPLFRPYKIDLTAVYKQDSTLAPQIDLTKGKHIVAFLSPSCIHCRNAALKMHEIELRNPAIPFYMIIVSTAGNINGFWSASKAQNIPYTRLTEKSFMKYTGGVFPQIYWLNNGWVEESVSYPDLNQKAIERWMASRY